MIDKLATIKLRESNSARFDKPVLDMKNGSVLLDGGGTPLKFVPSSCRSKFPIKASNEFKDNEQMKEILLEAKKDHEDWKQKIVLHAKILHC